MSKLRLTEPTEKLEPKLTEDELKQWADIHSAIDQLNGENEKAQLRLTAVQNGLHALSQNLQAIFNRSCAKQKIDPDEWKADREGKITPTE